MNDWEVTRQFADIICEGIEQDEIEALELLASFMLPGHTYEGDDE